MAGLDVVGSISGDTRQRCVVDNLIQQVQQYQRLSTLLSVTSMARIPRVCASMPRCALHHCRLSSHTDSEFAQQNS